MPKSKKPAGGRPAKNFEPRYGAKTSYQDRKRRPGESSAGQTGSKSPSHRGYRAGEETDTAPKRRWSAQEKAGREAAHGIRTHAGSDRSRNDRNDRPARSYDDRPARSYDNRPPRANDDRPARTYNDRPARSYDSRPPRSNDDRPARSYDNRNGSGRPAHLDRVNRDDRRSFGDARPSYRADRPARSYDDRPARSYDNRPPRSNDDRPARSYDSRPPRSYDNRPPRSNDDRPARSYDSRPPRSNDDRPARSYNDRPARSYDSRPPRSNDDRPARSYSDRPARSYDDRPRRDDRPARSYDSRPPRSNDNRPARSDWNAAPARDKAYEAHVDVVHERLQADAVQAEAVSDVTFGSLGLGENIVRVLADLGAATPFAIQAATIPPILEGKDVLARGRTGSGKTIAFGAPLVESILRSQAGQRREFGRKPKALILAPTRELALQIDRTIQPIARSVGLFTTQIYGGVPQARQVGALNKGVDIIIGTPGRIEDLVQQRKLDLSEVQHRRARRGRPHVRARVPRARAADPPPHRRRQPEAALLGDARP